MLSISKLSFKVFTFFEHNVIEHNLLIISSQLVDINEGFLSLMMDNGDVREDLRVPEGDLGKEIESKHGAGEDMMVSTEDILKKTEGIKDIQLNIQYLNV